MPIELLREFLGKECIISLVNHINAYKGTVVSAEGNWLRLEEKKKIRLVNAAVIRDIAIDRQGREVL